MPFFFSLISIPAVKEVYCDPFDLFLVIQPRTWAALEVQALHFTQICISVCPEVFSSKWSTGASASKCTGHPWGVSSSNIHQWQSHIAHLFRSHIQLSPVPASLGTPHQDPNGMLLGYNSHVSKHSLLIVTPWWVKTLSKNLPEAPALPLEHAAWSAANRWNCILKLIKALDCGFPQESSSPGDSSSAT